MTTGTERGRAVAQSRRRGWGAPLSGQMVWQTVRTLRKSQSSCPLQTQCPAGDSELRVNRLMVRVLIEVHRSTEGGPLLSCLL